MQHQLGDTKGGKEIELERCLCEVSVTELIVPRPRFRLFKKPWLFLQKSTWARARARFCCYWADLGPIQSSTVYTLSFSFSTRAKTILENCRKILKM